MFNVIECAVVNELNGVSIVLYETLVLPYMASEGGVIPPGLMKDFLRSPRGMYSPRRFRERESKRWALHVVKEQVTTVEFIEY